MRSEATIADDARPRRDDSASGRSKSIEPRRRGAAFRISNSSPISSNIGTSARVALARRRILLGQDRVDLGVGHPLGAADDAVVQLVADDVALGVDLHQARLHQAIDLRVERASPVESSSGSMCTARSGK